MSRSESDSTCLRYTPSLIALIAAPDRYQLKTVQVIGFANLEFEGNALYVGREDFERGLVANAVWIDVPDSLMPKDSSLRRGYYIVDGRFRADVRGHMGMFSGTIDSISRFERWPSHADIEGTLKSVPELGAPDSTRLPN